jgi:hypothetical protein
MGRNQRSRWPGRSDHDAWNAQSATIRALSDRSEVTFVASGAPHEGEEDVACAELMAASLRRVAYSRESVIAAVVGSRAAAKHQIGDVDFPVEDIECAVAIDAFDFAMKAERERDRWIARPCFA